MFSYSSGTAVSCCSLPRVFRQVQNSTFYSCGLVLHVLKVWRTPFCKTSNLRVIFFFNLSSLPKSKVWKHSPLPTPIFFLRNKHFTVIVERCCVTRGINVSSIRFVWFVCDFHKCSVCFYLRARERERERERERGTERLSSRYSTELVYKLIFLSVFIPSLCVFHFFFHI